MINTELELFLYAALAATMLFFLCGCSHEINIDGRWHTYHNNQKDVEKVCIYFPIENEDSYTYAWRIACE